MEHSHSITQSRLLMSLVLAIAGGARLPVSFASDQLHDVGDATAQVLCQSERTADEGAGTRTTPRSAPIRPAAGTISIPNARTPLPGLVTGGQPSATDLKIAKDQGFHTVINLRPGDEVGVDAEEASTVSKLGMRYVSIPVSGAADLTAENVKKLAAALSQQDALPAIVHCASGNRAGALLALKAYQIDGRSAEEALELGKNAGLTAKLEPAVRERLHQ